MAATFATGLGALVAANTIPGHTTASISSGSNNSTSQTSSPTFTPNAGNNSTPPPIISSGS